MKILIISAVLTLVALAEKRLIGNDDLTAEIEKAKQRLQTDFIVNLWCGANEAISESQDKLLQLYTEYTIQQAQHVVEHITHHRNVTRLECAVKRANALSTKNPATLVSTLECMFASEDNTLKAFKMTGYNLHNCIRMAQNEMEGKYLKIVENLKTIMKISLEAYQHHYKNLENCAENFCVMSTLFRSLIDYERFKEEVATNVTQVNTMSTRYVFSRIAMGCISGSLSQISENFKIGMGLVNNCLLRINETTPINAMNSAENANKTASGSVKNNA